MIYIIFKDPTEGKKAAKKAKKDFDQNIGMHEVFLESVPTVLIMFVIGVRALGIEVTAGKSVELS